MDLASETVRILLVDDDAADRALAIRTLRRGLAGIGIEEVEDADGLRQAVARADFDAVITDYNLGWSDGIEILREIRRRVPECPVILFTGALSDELAVDAMKAGMTDYVLKDPSRALRLPEAVRVAVRSARQQQAAREAENALVAQGRVFRALIEHGSDIIAVLDAAGVIRFGSPSVARVLGYSAGEFSGHEALAFVHPEDRPMGEEKLRLLLTSPSGTAVPLDGIRLRRKDGSWRTLEGTAVNVLTDPAIRGIVASARDVTERQAAEEALRNSQDQLYQSQKMEAVGRLAAGVAHDFNNLLTAITCFNDVVMSSLTPEHPLREPGAEIAKAVGRASALTRQLLAFSRRQILQPQVLDPLTLLGEIEEMLRRLIGEDVALAIETDPSVGCVRADPGQLEQILMNLVVNARDAMPNGGTLTISLGNSDDERRVWRATAASRPAWVRFTVGDTGMGMDEQTKAQIFEPFFTTKEPGRGTGLGLSTVYGIVRQSGGFVTVESEPGRGSIFRVYLPRIDEPAEALRSNVTSPIDGRGSEKILMVEDEEIVRVPLAAILRRYGYTVLEAANGEEAITLCERVGDSIDALVTDLVMPGMSGRELAERLQELRPGLRVLFTSGYSDHVALHRDGLAPSVAFLHKPFSAEILARRLRQLFLSAPSPTLAK